MTRLHRTPVRLSHWLALFALGCGSKGAVTLTAQVQNPSVTPQTVALGTALTGGFDLVLDLGAEAPKATAATPGAVAIRNEKGPVVDGLSVNFAESPPFDVAVGGNKTVAATLDATKLLETSTRDALCAGDVWYVVSVSDTLSGNTSTAQSARFLASCQ